MTAICPCDDDVPAVPANLPHLDRIDFRFGTYASFRRAVLTPVTGDVALSVWRTQGQGDLAVMVAEWFAYLGDILTFYDERIANQAYLRTADRPASVKRLTMLLGYRPRPAVGATGILAALVTAGQSAVLPKGLQIQSKPSPGHPPQTFELAAATLVGSPDRLAAVPPPRLLAPIAEFRFRYLSLGLGYALPAKTHHGKGLGAKIIAYPTPIDFAGSTTNFGLLLAGAVTSIDPGALVVLRPRDPGSGDPLLATVSQATVQPAPGGGQQTSLALTIDGTPPDDLTAAAAALERANQSANLWSLFDGAVSGATVHLASLNRQIRPGAWVLFTAASIIDPFLVQVSEVSETVWDGTGTSAVPATPPAGKTAYPIPHTKLTLASSTPSSWPANSGSITVAFDWISAGRLLDQPPAGWSGTPTALVAATAARFPAVTAAEVIVADTSGGGFVTTASSAGDFNVQLCAVPAPPPTLQPPFAILFNPLAVSRGKTVAREIVGSGDATRPAQSFPLKQSPVTYLAKGAAIASTVSLTVNGEPWTEVASFYGQPPKAQVFVTREDVGGQTHVEFGDGVNGARLPSGTNNVVATYRIGAGADAPPAGKLTVIAQSFPGLRSLLNPVAVGGGADAEAPARIRRYAPRSVLTFGRAVSVFDYEALAAQAPGVTRARAIWAWNNARQRSVVTVYVGDDAAAATSAKAVLAGASDPNRPVSVVQATAVFASLALTLVVQPGRDTDTISALVTAALTDPDTGLFSADALPIGQPMFDSRIEAAVLAVPGVVAVIAIGFTADGVFDDTGPLHHPGDGGYFVLDPADVILAVEVDPNGG